MAYICYQFTIHEVEVENGEVVREYETNLPHHKEICETVKKNWKMCHIENTFDGHLKNMVKSCDIQMMRTRGDETLANISIHLNDGERWSARRRAAYWQQLDAQMTDGFGESMEYAEIDGVDERYRIII